MSNFEKMTVVQLKEYAKDNGVDLDGAKNKNKYSFYFGGYRINCWRVRKQKRHQLGNYFSQS